MRGRAKKQVSRHRSEEDERGFWASADSSDYVDWRRAKLMAFPDLRPSTRTTSLRLPDALPADLKILACMRDVPYQSLLMIFLAERIRQEFGWPEEAG